MSNGQREQFANASHASDEALASYASGKLSDDLYARIRDHLKTCRTCQTRMDEWNAEQSLAVASTKTPSKNKTRRTAVKPQAATVSNKKSDTLPAFQNTNYKILREIGRGGMGILYLVEHALTARLEVIKVIHPDLIGRLDVRARFLREIQHAAKLNHPNVVQTLSAFEDGDTIGMVMEYAPGTTLSDLVKKSGPFPVFQALELCLQAASALQHANECGMVHRDIKPSNMMIDSSGNCLNLKLLDFGLAKSTSELAVATDLTIVGSILGTPDYMSPEQAMNPSQADIRSDIYSLGCTFYFMLIGRPPFQGLTALAILNAHQKGFIPSLNVRHPNLPPCVLSLLTRMITPRIADRFQSPTEVIKELQFAKDVLLGLAVDNDRSPNKKNDPMQLETDAFQQSAKDSIKNFFLEGSSDSPNSSNTVTIDFSNPILSTKRKPKKKPSRSWVPTIIAACLPTIVIAAAIYFKQFDPWISLLRNSLSGSPFFESSIILVDLPSDITVYIDGHEAKFQRPKAGAPPEISAAPGSYSLSFRQRSKEIDRKSVTLTEKTTRYSLNCANLHLKSRDSLGTGDSQRLRVESLPVEKPRINEWEDVNVIERKYAEAIDQLGNSNASISEELTSWLNKVESKREEYGEKIQLLFKADDLIRRYRNSIQDAVTKVKPADQLTLFRVSEEIESETATVIHTKAVQQIVSIVEADKESIELKYRGKNLRIKLNAIPLTINRALIGLAIDKNEPQKRILELAGCVISKGVHNGDLDRSFMALSEQSKNILGNDLVPVFKEIRRSILKNEVPFDSAGSVNVDIAELPSLYDVNRELVNADATIQEMHFLVDGRLTTLHGLASTTIRNWSTKTGESELVKTRPVRIVHYAVSPNGKIVAAFSEIKGTGFELTVIIEKTKTFLVQTQPDLLNAIGIYFSADNKGIATVDGLGRFERWNLQLNKKTLRTASKFPLAVTALSAICVSPKLDLVAQANKENGIHVWQTKDGEKLGESKVSGKDPGGNSAIVYMQFDKSGDGLLVFRKNGKIECLDIPTLDLKRSINAEFGEIESVNQSENGEFLLFLGLKNRVGVFDTKQMTFSDQWVHKSPHKAVCASVSNNGDQVAVGYENGSIVTWKKTQD